MKKIIGIIFVSLMFTNIGYAEIRLIEYQTLEVDRHVTTVCVDGLKFVIAQSSNTGGISIVQFYKRGDRAMAPPQPVKC